MKRILLILALALLTACASPSSDPRQQALDATYKTAVAVNASITATRAAVQAGVLKGADAANAIKALDATVASLKAAQMAIAAQPAASGAAK